MQPTESQVQRSLAALRAATACPDGPDDRRERATGTREVDHAPEVPDEVLERLRAEPAVRPDRLAAARRRLAVGDVPSDEALAERMVGRLVCDRLR
jgi:hypothetical protein